MKIKLLLTTVSIIALSFAPIASITTSVQAAPSPREVIIKCFNPKFKSPRLVRVVQGAKRFPIAQVASTYGCLWWQVIKQKPFRTPPAVGRLRSGCDPEQARAMGFKPERGDCN